MAQRILFSDFLLPLIKGLIFFNKFLTIQLKYYFRSKFSQLMTTRLFKQKVKAYTLTEILVVIGILVLLALPNLLPLITKAKSTEAKVQLEHLSTLQQSFFYEKSKYSPDLGTKTIGELDGGQKLLNQYNSVESLMENTIFTPTKQGVFHGVLREMVIQYLKL